MFASVVGRDCKINMLQRRVGVGKSNCGDVHIGGFGERLLKKEKK